MFTVFREVQAISPSCWIGWCVEGRFGERLEEGPNRTDVHMKSVRELVFLGRFAKRGIPPETPCEVVSKLQ